MPELTWIPCLMNYSRDVIQQTKQSWIFDTIAEAEKAFTYLMMNWNTKIRRAAEQQNRDAQKYAALLESQAIDWKNSAGQLQHEKIYQFLIHQCIR